MSDTSVWNRNNLINKNKYKFYPSEVMLRSIFSNSYFNIENINEGGNLLDIGTLYTNNMTPFVDRGWRCFGTEVTDESVQIARESAKLNGLDVDVSLGFNMALPYEDKKFDLLLSLSTIHYEENEDDVKAALSEFYRVLKNDGVALIQTVAPKHDIFTNSKKIKKNIYQLNMQDDIRNGQKFIFFKQINDFIDIASNFFKEIEIARVTESYPKGCIDYWLVKLQKI